jgi:replicative DNA helicase
MRELNIPIIALSQLSRQVEQREDKRPQLSDLRESGTIEQDSDVVMFIFRESYYLERMEPLKRPEENDDKHNERHQRWRELCESSYNKAEIIIAKQRHGPIGSIKAHFDPNFTRFSDLTTTEYDNMME